MSNWIKFFTSANAFLIKATNGRLGSRLGKQSVLLLHTIGRKSGKSYVTPLSYYRDAENYIVIASNWGGDDHPSWYYNLINQTETTIQVGTENISVNIRQAKYEEYKRLWEIVTIQNNQYLKYQKGLARQIPIIVLTQTKNQELSQAV